MRYLKKHIMVFFAFMRVSWRTSIEYMNDFVFLLADFLVTIVTTILFWKYLLADYDHLGSWDFKELILIGIFGSASWAIGEIFSGSWQLPQKITSGRLDKYLCKPVNAVFALVVEDMQLDEVIKGFTSLAVLLVWYRVKFGVLTNIWRLLLSIVSMLIGIAIVALVRSIFSCVAFWFENTSGLNTVIHMEDYGLDRYPLEIFGKVSKVLLLTIVPVGYIACVPAMFFLGKLKYEIAVLFSEALFIIVLIFLLKVIWSRGVKRYEANGG